MSAHSFFRPHRRIRKPTPPRTPSEPLGSTLPSTPTSVSTPTDILVLDDGASTPTIADERQIPTSSQCVFPINWDKIRYNGKPVPSIRYRQPHKRTLNSKLQPSAIYKHGAQLTTDGDNKYWLCKYCHIRGHHHTALFSSESTTSVIYHLKHQHKLEDFGYQAALSNPFSMAKGTTNPTSYLGGRRSVFNDLQFKDDFIDWVIDLDLTFRQVTHQRTHEIFTNHLEDIGKILPKSPSALSNWIKEKWVGDAGRRVWLVEKLHVATSKIHISVDAWTSEEGTNYLAVVAHFLDESHKLQTALLDLPPLKGPHSGENLAKALSKVIDFYDISTVIGFFMMDNAGNNDTCIQELAKQYPAIKLQSRLRCVGHMLNLIVKALLFGQGVSKMEQQLRGASDEERFEIWRKQSFIGKLHNFCVWVNRSDQRRELLKQYVLTAYDEGSIECLYTRVLVDGGIRWNSAYAMIERALKLRHAIDLFFLNYNHIGKEYDISQDMLTPQDWIDLEHFLGILKPFKDLTKRMEGRANKAGLEGSHGSLYETIESLDVLFKELQEAGKFADNHPEVVSTYYSYAIDTARVKLEEYFGLTDATPAYRCAVALHPANKFTYFELEWSHNKQWISEAKRVVREVYAQYEEAAAKTGTIGAQPQEKVIDDNDVALDPLQQARKRRQRLAATAASGSRGNKRIKLTSELDEFMARANKADVEVEDPLEWWVCHASDYPILSKMAFDLFSCPAMSAECERVFSQTKKVITDERNRLNDADSDDETITTNNERSQTLTEEDSKGKREAKNSPPPTGARHKYMKGKKRRNYQILGLLRTQLHDLDKQLKLQKKIEEKEQQDRLKNIPEEYRIYEKLFKEELETKVPQHSRWDHEIWLKTDDLPFQKIYNLNEKELTTLKEYLETELAKGNIRISTSSAGFPVMFVPKKNGKLRLVVDYRKLNALTIKDRTPLPLITELKDRLQGKQIFTALDLKGAYNLIRIKEGDEWKTAFRTKFGLFEYLVMPFGLTNAPATFQRMINNVLRQYLDVFVVCYLDDILIFSDDEEEHKEHVHKVLKALQDANLLVEPEKSHFHVKEVDFLGHTITPGEIRMERKKISAVADWPKPTTVKEVQSFLGFAQGCAPLNSIN
ncbi:Transposon Tf2-6 polyprotein [Fusarium oxysporum f. sp. conglutinans]|nr:Transposon Tf2-6 polyprotein [Fusarium oxysporum f. sp. conglutinans]